MKNCIKYIACVSILLLGMVDVVFSQEFRSQSKRYNEEADTLIEGDVTARVMHGIVTSAKDKEPLAIALIRQLGVANNATYAELDGRFSIKLDVSKPCKLVCSYMGFFADTITVTDKTRNISFKLMESYTTLTDAVVSASRKNERKFESPVTIDILSIKDLQVNPSMNMYERITNIATVDAITTSVNFKTLNTRGFNSSYNQRFIQRVDNMDLSMPGFNLSLGALNGPIDLDVERMELIPGANSALYGPNAISGLMNSTTKNPFRYEGLSVELKNGVSVISNSTAASNRPLVDMNLRYAKILTKKLASKITMGYMQMDDWRATDYRDVSNYKFSNNLTNYGYATGPGNPGYNGLNIGGDEISAVFDTSIKAPVTNQPFLEKGALRVSRTGYREDELFTYKPYMLKGDVGFFFRPKKDVELSVMARFGKGSSNFQTDNRTQITGYFLQQYRVEVKAKKWAFRSYVSIEDIGEAIDISLTSINVNRTAKLDENWFMQYLLAYSGQYNNLAKSIGMDTLVAGDDAAARKFADSDNSKLYPYLNIFDTVSSKLILGGARYQPGSAVFDSVLSIIKTKAFKDDGGRIKSNSKTWYSELVYNFVKPEKNYSILAGVNHRLYAPSTSGSVFPDTIHAIFINEAGGFLQAGKSFFNNKLKTQASTRLDVFQRFKPRFSPRVSVVYMLGAKQQHSLRASAQIGFRMPALIDQFSYLNVKGALTFGGFLEDAIQLGLVKQGNDGSQLVNLYTQSSVNEFLYSGDSTKLVKPVIKSIAPEELRTIEFGWRSFLKEKIESDVNLYLNSFQNLINAQQYVGAKNRSDTLTPSYIKNQQQTQVYRRAANAQFPVSSMGVSLTINYYKSKKWTYYANYNYNKLITSETFISQNFQKGFNTPTHKINAGVKANNVFKNLGLAANARWVDAFYFAEYDRVGVIDAYYSIDLAFNYTLTKYKTMLKLGGTNIANTNYIQALGSPTVGALFYISVLYDGLIK